MKRRKRFLKECLSQTIFSVLKSQCSNSYSTLSLVLYENELFQVMHVFSFRIMQDHSEGSSLQNQALQTLQERLHEADATLKREQESYKQMQVRLGDSQVLLLFGRGRTTLSAVSLTCSLCNKILQCISEFCFCDRSLIFENLA